MMGQLLSPQGYGDYYGIATSMNFDRRQLVPLLKELIGRQAMSDEYRGAYQWLYTNVPVFVSGVQDIGPQRRRFEIALRRAASGTELCFYDRQILEQIADRLHEMFGETLFEGAGHVA